MSTSRNELLRTAFDAYLTRLDEGKLAPADNYLPYEFDEIDSRQWRVLGYDLVKDELREVTNNLNHWHHLLRRWHAWNDVIRPYAENEAWDLRREFVEALAHHCLLMPSSIRDTFTFVATNSMHQVRLVVSSGYSDYLEGDPKSPSDKPEHLSRGKKEKRLAKIISNWPEAAAFMGALRKIDDNSYKDATSNYRNLNSHSIGPRLGIGITRTVVRSVEQATRLEEQPDGTFRSVAVPGKMTPRYGFGGTEPLDMEKARAANLDQYGRARDCYLNYRQLLDVGLASMPSPARTE